MGAGVVSARPLSQRAKETKPKRAERIEAYAYVPTTTTPKETTMSVRKFLDLSTGHVPPSQREAIGTGDTPTCCMEGEYGWLFYVSAYEELYHRCWRDIFAFARAAGCDYVMLDRDAEGCAGLPWYDDSETPQEQPSLPAETPEAALRACRDWFAECAATGDDHAASYVEMCNRALGGEP
jgi:hypothetical protein